MNILETLSNPDTMKVAWFTIAVVGALLASCAGALGAAWLFNKSDIIDSLKDDLKG